MGGDSSSSTPPVPTTVQGPNGSTTIFNMGNAAKGGSGGISDYLLGGGIGLGALNALGLFGTQGSNPVNNSAVSSASANMNTPLPQYNYNSVSTPLHGELVHLRPASTNADDEQYPDACSKGRFNQGIC